MGKNHIYLEQELLNLMVVTKLFQDDACSLYSIDNLTSYLFGNLLYSNQNDFDPFISLVNATTRVDWIDSTIYSPIYSGVPYLDNFDQNLTYHKYISLLKSYIFNWMK